MDILQSVMDSASHAMFTMDRQGIVTHINQQAKERFGLYNHSVYSHPAGRLEPGDVVILATSAMGADDGNLAPEDLAAIGTLGTELCTVELWRVDASGRTVPVDVPQEPDIQEFFAKSQPVPDDVNPSVLICLGMGGLRAHPVFWNKTGMLYLPLANEIGYRWDGHRFQKVVRPHAEGSGEPADGLDIE